MRAPAVAAASPSFLGSSDEVISTAESTQQLAIDAPENTLLSIGIVVRIIPAPECPAITGIS